MRDATLATRLERYTLQHPKEVLMVHATIEDEPDQIVIFRGFSSSLMRPTAFDPEVPVLPESAAISHIDRMEGPYQPQKPVYIEKDIALADFMARFV